MDSGLKYTREINGVYLSTDCERKLSRYDRKNVLTELSFAEAEKDYDIHKQLSFKAGDKYYKASVLFETPFDLYVLDIKEIKVDELLDAINTGNYIKHGIQLQRH